MPILEVRGLPQKNPEIIPQALKKTTLAIAKQYGCSPNQVWAIWEDIKPSMYVEGELSAIQQPDNTHPPIAILTCFEGKTSQQIEDTLLEAARVLSESLGVPNNIFIRYQEAKSGQVIAGNGVVRS